MGWVCLGVGGNCKTQNPPAPFCLNCHSPNPNFRPRETCLTCTHRHHHLKPCHVWIHDEKAATA
ncbi:unnamed protein product, partial [Chrysoparadoxa australica]